MAQYNTTETVRRAVDNNGTVQTYGMSSQQKQQTDAEYARLKDVSTKR